MKIRTGFVTNSSSSSFVLSVVKTKDGKEYNLGGDTEAMFNLENVPTSKNGKLYIDCYVNYDETVSVPIKSVKDLAAILFMNELDFMNEDSIKAGMLMFSFLCKKISPRALIEKLGNMDGFEELLDIEPDDYDDKEELREEIAEISCSVLADEHELYMFEDGLELEEELGDYIDFIKNVKKISDIEKVTFLINESEYGEFVGQYSERVGALKEKYQLVAMSEDDDNYAKEFDKWCDILRKEVFWMEDSCEFEITPSVEVLVKNALSSGDYFELVPNYVDKRSEEEVYF